MFSIPKDNKKNKKTQSDVKSDDIEATKSKMKAEVSEAASEVDKQVSAVIGENEASDGAKKVEGGKSEADAGIVEKEEASVDDKVDGASPEVGLENAIGDILSGEKKVKRYEFNEAVHVMPKEYSKKAQKIASKSNLVVIIAVLVVVGLIVLVVAYVFIKSKTSNNVDMNGNGAVLERKMIEEENFSDEAVKSKVDIEALEVEVPEPILSGDEQRNIRDSQRITDIQNLRSALDDYYSEFSEYPVILDKLIETRFISELPKNPEPGGDRYVYELSVDYQSYTLDYVLEGKKGIYSEGNQRATNNTMSTRDNPQEIIQKAIEKSAAEIDSEIEGDVESGTSTVDILEVKEEVVATSTATEVEVIQAESVGAESGVDSDGDGVSDREEILFGMNSDTSDSDGDGYSDKEELLSLNNPSGLGLLLGSGTIQKYTNRDLSYELYYPTAWSYSSAGGSGSLIFKSLDNQSIQVLSPTNVDLLPINEWYHAEVSSRAIQDSQQISMNGWQGLYSPDGLTVYLGYAGSSRVFVISYSPGFNSTFDYKNVFNVMVNSFKEVNIIIPVEEVVEIISTSTEEITATTTEN